MSLFSSKPRNSNNRKPEPNLLGEDLKSEDPPAYERSRLLAAGSEGWLSGVLDEPQHMLSYQSTSHSSNRAEPIPSMVLSAIELARKPPTRRTSSSTPKDSRFSSRSDPSLVASSSYGVHQSRRSASSSERHKPEPPIPLPPRSTTVPVFDNKYAISYIPPNSTTRLEPAIHNRSILPYVPDHLRAASQQIPPSHPSRSTKQYSRPRASSGTASEDRAVAFVDMKRLLSKPALPSSAITSIPSPPPPQSDSEFSSSAGSHTGQSQASTSESIPTSDGVRNPRKREPIGLQDKGSPTVISLARVTGMSSPPQLSSSPEESSLSHQNFPSLPHKQKQPSVLKRRPSGARPPSLSSPIKLFPVTKLAGSSGRQTTSHLTIDPALSRRCGGRRREASQSTSSSPLTPAGAVAEAYKQQEQKRDYLSLQASGSGEEQTPRIMKWPFPDEDRKQASSAPYHPVFGGSPDRLVSIGDIDGSTIDCRYSKPDLRTGHGLKRKVSVGWKKATAGIRGDEFASVNSDLALGVQGRRSISLPRENTKPIGRSLDMRSPDACLPSDSISPMQYIFPAKAKASIAVEEDMRPKPGKLIKPRGDRGEKDEDGNKIWKLMKRISTGGLREKYQMGNSPPPVPPLPKNTPFTDVDSFGVPPASTKPQASKSTTSKGLSPSVSPRASPARKTGPWSASGSRPSIATGSSSSPGSSDFASTRFFHQSHSTQSSSSSNCEAPPIPTTVIGQYIVPPSELYRLNIEQEVEMKSSDCQSHAPRRSMSLPVRDSLPPPDYWPEYTRPSLPHPPRRAVTAGNQGTYQRDKSSPELPLTSTEDTDNNTHDHPSRIPKSEFGLSPSSPPAHLSINSTRQRLRSLSISTQDSSFSPSTSSTKTSPSDGSHDNYFDADNPNRKSLGAVSNASTARQHSNPFKSPDLFTTGVTPTTSTRSPLNFRELETSSHTALTAKEKADIWNNLLERSDRAGGTLHMGGQELMSEQMRLSPSLSNYTEITDIP